MAINRFLKKWIVPQGFLELKRSIRNPNNSVQPYSIQKKSNMAIAANSLGAFKGRYIRKRCYILATGPSIEKQDLTILRGQHCIAVSMFHLHRDIKLLKPIWHVLAPTHAPFKYELPEKFFSSAFSAYSDLDDINFLLGSVTYEYSYHNYLTKEPNKFLSRFNDFIHFVDFDNCPTLGEREFMNEEVWDLEKRPFKPRTVIYTAIQLAYFLGFNEIVLVGCDHDYLNDINRVENHHFYEESKGVSDKEHLGLFDRERWFFEYYSRWRDFRLMRTFLMSKGVRVFNATEGGMLDVFERRNLESFVNV